MEPYPFQNVYLITTYRCNHDCDFCLFKHNKEKEAAVEKILSQLFYAVTHSEKPVYLKITGGEPFLCKELLKEVIKFCHFFSFEDEIYKIGIGTNGSIPFPDFLTWTEVPVNIFLSRHTYLDTLPSVEELTREFRPKRKKDNVQFRINCNLIKGQVGNLAKMRKHMLWHLVKSGIDHFTFRELNHISLEDNLFYPKQIYQYEQYYKEHLVTAASIEEEIAKDPEFELSRVTGNYYDTNRWYWWHRSDGTKISVKFRIIDEQKLVQYNKENEGVDEYVIHPDGTLTGCWDKELKPIRK